MEKRNGKLKRLHMRQLIDVKGDAKFDRLLGRYGQNRTWCNADNTLGHTAAHGIDEPLPAFGSHDH